MGPGAGDSRDPAPLRALLPADAVAAVRKLVTCAMEAGQQVTQELATSKLAATIDLIVHLDLRTTSSDGVSYRHRQVAEIIAIEPGERDTGYATTHVFTPDRSGRAAPAVLPPVTCWPL